MVEDLNMLDIYAGSTEETFIQDISTVVVSG